MIDFKKGIVLDHEWPPMDGDSPARIPNANRVRIADVELAKFRFEIATKLEWRQEIHSKYAQG